MTQYRLRLTYVTSGHALIETTTDWVDHRDQLDEMLDTFGPFENELNSFTSYEVEEKRDVTLEATGYDDGN